MGERLDARDTRDRVGEQARIKDAYRRYAASSRRQRAWALDNSGNIEMRRELLERLLAEASNELAGQAEILDIGCGVGWWVRALAEQGVSRDRLHGVDLLPSRVEAAAGALEGAQITHGDARALPYDDGRFEVVLLFTVLSSLPSREAVLEALGEARRVLAPGGILLAYEPRLPNPTNRATRWVSRADFERGLESRTLGVSTLTVLPPLSRRLGRLARSLYGRLARWTPLRTHRLVTYRRP
jgi:ubiquinone/menaquinone biosynthesis C-methylase UbiE